ncbi:MAG: hypothetical protein QOI89_3519 [Solirubrobacteraceae bacterium]|nr:hypothetical protein [Solirubrobacteraceae bacterium]
MQNAETVLGILRERNTGSHRRAGRSETIISGSGGAVLGAGPLTQVAPRLTAYLALRALLSRR